MTPTPATLATEIRQRADTFAEAVVRRQYEAEPHWLERYGERGRQRCLEDAVFHLKYLASAMEYARPGLFADYLEWARRLLAERKIPARDLERNLDFLCAVLTEGLPAGSEAILREYLGCEGALQTSGEKIETFLQATSPVASLRAQYLEFLLARRRHDASRALLSAVSEGLSIETSYMEIFQPVQYEVGRLWQMNRITVAQEHYCTAVTQSVMAQLYDRLFSTPRAGRRAVVASVGGDLHEIGGRMVADLLEFAGWDTVYLGASTPAEAIAKMAAEHDAQVVALSVTMTYNLTSLREAISAIRAHAGCGQTRILVGGRPFLLEPDLWQEVGADATARDGREAVAVANQVLARN